MWDYEKIIAWQFADDLTVAMCKRTQEFPKEERVHGLIKAVEKEVSDVPKHVLRV